MSPTSPTSWARFGPGAVGIGWDLALRGLARHVSGDGPVDPQRAAAWLGPDDGRQFITLSSEQWWQASITAGRTVACCTRSGPVPGS